MAKIIRLLSIFILIGGGLVAYFSAYIIDVRKVGVERCLGKITRTVNPAGKDAGLYFMVPFACEISIFDRTIMTHTGNVQEIATGREEKNFVKVDYFVMWRIDNAEKYYLKFRGQEANAVGQIDDYIRSALQNQFNNRNVEEIVGDSREKIMIAVLKAVNDKVNDANSVKPDVLGIKVVDVRIKQIELNANILTAIHKQMRNERDKVATATRAEGDARARNIRAEGERENKQILAIANSSAEQKRGEADAKAIKVYADAYNKNPQFFEYLQSLEAYKKAFNHNDVMVLEPDSEFFKYFSSSQGK